MEEYFFESLFKPAALTEPLNQREPLVDLSSPEAKRQLGMIFLHNQSASIIPYALLHFHPAERSALPAPDSKEGEPKEGTARADAADTAAQRYRTRMFSELLEQSGALDTDKDGTITATEIDAAIKDPAVTGAKARAVATLKLFERSQAGESTPRGVKVADLHNLASLRQVLQAGKHDRTKVLALLKRYQDKDANDKDIEAITSLANEFILKNGGKKDAPGELNKFAQNIPKLIAELEQLQELELRFDRIARRSKAIEQFEAKLYGSSGDPRRAIKPEAVCQGLVGNCYFMAAVASLAELDPSAIEKLIKENSNGTFTVTFPGKKPVTVAAPTTSELILYAGLTEHGIWPAVLEKAFGRFCKENADFRKGKVRGETDQEGSEGGGTTEGICILTGREGTILQDIGPADRDKVWQRMRDAVNGRLPVIVGSGFAAETFLNDGKNSGLESRHAYAVIRIDDEMITLRNPYGRLAAVTNDELSETGKMTGSFKLPKKLFWKYFSEVELLK